MSKSRFKSETERLKALLGVLSVDPLETSDEELDGLLDDAGVDMTALQGRLCETARELSLRERREGRTAPRYLSAVMDELDPGPELPRKAKAALRQAARWIGGYVAEPHAPSTPKVVEAYRKGNGSISAGDREILDQAAQELLERVEPDENE